MTPPRPLPRFDAVLFDLDGTLANTIPLILECFRHAMSVHRPGEALDEAFVLSHVGRTLRETMAEFSDSAERAEAFTATYLERQHELHDGMVAPYVGALGHVERWVESKVPIAIVTSKGREMTRRTMHVCALDVHFDHVITADDVTRGKPDPEPVRIALERLGMAASPRVLFVGDSPHDIAAGKAAGVSTVGVTWGAMPREHIVAAEPDHVVTKFEELERIGWG